MARWDQVSTTTVPQWFWDAVETEYATGTVEVDECDIYFQDWHSSSSRELLLIHGMNAHSHWWDFIAPQVADMARVVAMDLSGMGDSDYRYEYDAETYEREIVAVCDAAGLSNNVTVVGHSFGGTMAVKAFGSHRDRFGSLVLVDSGIRAPDEPLPEYPLMGGGRAKIYPDRESAESRFRLFPPQPCENEFILKYIAKHSLTPVEGGGWAWKFDEELPLTLKGSDRIPSEYEQLDVPLGLIYGELSESFTQATLEYMLELLPNRPLIEKISDARHHVFLDQPQRFVAALRLMLDQL